MKPRLKTTHCTQCDSFLKLKAIERYDHKTSSLFFKLPDRGAVLSLITSLVIVRASECTPF
jgi:hypothetical protein